MLADLFTTIVYQPFFNILVFFYWALAQLSPGYADMGVAVILLTILIRILLLPMSLAGERSEEERRQIAAKAKELEAELSHDPVQLRAEMKKLFRERPQVVIAEISSLAIQIMISLMLWRIFSTGLEGKDLHLIYPFVPTIDEPFNLMFMNKFNLGHSMISGGLAHLKFDGSVFWLNLLQSIFIFILETLSIYTSPYPSSRSEVVRLQLVLPVVSFFVFMFLPAGKKLFVITTLAFSILLTLTKFIRRRFQDYSDRQAALAAAKEEGAEPIVVDVK